MSKEDIKKTEKEAAEPQIKNIKELCCANCCYAKKMDENFIRCTRVAPLIGDNDGEHKARVAPSGFCAEGKK